MPDPETTARTKGCQRTADLAGSILEAGLGVNQVVSQNDLGWEKSEVKCRLYEQEKQCGEIQSASLTVGGWKWKKIRMRAGTK